MHPARAAGCLTRTRLQNTFTTIAITIRGGRICTSHSLLIILCSECSLSLQNNIPPATHLLDLTRLLCHGASSSRPTSLASELAPSAPQQSHEPPYHLRFPEIHPFYEYYSKELTYWAKIPASYVFTITTNTQLFIRRAGVIGGDQAHHLSRIAPPATSCNMLTTSKCKQSSTPINIKDNTKPTVKQEPIMPPCTKCPCVKHDTVHGIKLELVTPPRGTHPRLGLDSLDSSEIIDLTTPSPPSLTFSSSSSSSSSLLSFPSLASSSSLEFPHPIHLLSRLDTTQIAK
ncbi:hypothetical protein DFH08DRAFT_936397 [Mycena albidolilacea]|uniref:Uncharacterized protein n=1 Tax=Mycena albidolilacea TaxID=1033008 RepID=A0AAD7ETP7_9AGAR|nr:hypothetical protein DFH08DRAFT_936397 [Mycena albidolilacea]